MTPALSVFALIVLLAHGASSSAAIQVTSGPPSAAAVSGSVGDGSGSGQGSVFRRGDPLTVTMSVDVDAADRGRALPLYMVASYDAQWLMATGAGVWTSWDGTPGGLSPYAVRPLGARETLIGIQSTSLASGEYGVYAGYGRADGSIVYEDQPLAFAVFDQGNPSLHAIQQPRLMERYLKDGLKPGFGNSYADLVVVGAQPDDSASVDTGAGETVSTTNLQVAGVDEADRIKSDGEHLYVLGDCSSGGLGGCMRLYTLSEAPPGTALLAELELNMEVEPSGLYLLDERGPAKHDMLVAVGSGGDGGFEILPTTDLWPYPPAWQASRTELVVFELDASGQPGPLTRVRMDGRMVASRRIADTLYLVTRFTPYPDTYIPYPYGPEDQAANEALLDAMPLEGLLPKIRIGDGAQRHLADPDRCFLAPPAEGVMPEPSMISLTAIPVDDPGGFYSVCLAGPTEAVFVSPQTLYLASTRYRYNAESGDALVYLPDHLTDIHKFALEGLEYRGSGAVIGHLGWEEDKKPFRFGEHEGVLQVATSVGDTWNDTASTRVSLWREDAAARMLSPIGSLENLGKPGERLYAVRFLGDRGFLVTFKVTDPLMVLDLADPANPKVAGELFTEGYSDYLHPVGETYLLGIGKDAIPDDGSPDFGFRGAWYQGVKLSLFDISDLSDLREVDSLVLGKRGTDSELLQDHLALAYLPPEGGAPARVAIPLALHDRPGEAPYFDPSQPDAYYGWTHSGLYVFDLDVGQAPAIEQIGRIITAEYPDTEPASRWGSRVLLQGRAAHYIEGNAVYSGLFPPRL